MYKNILVPLDGSELAECVLPHVEAIATGCGSSTVTFLRVVEPVYMAVSAEPDAGYTFSARDWQKLEDELRSAAKNYLDRLVARTKYKNVTIQSEVITGKAAESIAAYANEKEADLITIATHGRSGIGRWVWGSVADKVLRTAITPILMIRPPGCAPTTIA
jgi:nucleotide-binding universal stress UspA family protein